MIYAHRRDSVFHEQAARVVATLAEGNSQWALPWPCLHEFIGIVTRPRIFDPPSTLAEALNQVKVWLKAPSIVLLAEADNYWPHLSELLLTGRAIGGLVHDARIAALCLQHGVRELWTADRDFSRFPQLRAVNPLVR